MVSKEILLITSASIFPLLNFSTMANESESDNTTTTSAIAIPEATQNPQSLYYLHLRENLDFILVAPPLIMTTTTTIGVNT